MVLSMEMLNIRKFPTFVSIAEEIVTNIGLIRAGFPPHVSVPNANISAANVCFFHFQFTWLICDLNFLISVHLQFTSNRGVSFLSFFRKVTSSTYFQIVFDIIHKSLVILENS